MTAVRGTAVDITTEDGTADSYPAHPADGKPRPGVLFQPRHEMGQAQDLRSVSTN